MLKYFILNNMIFVAYVVVFYSLSYGFNENEVYFDYIKYYAGFAIIYLIIPVNLYFVFLFRIKKTHYLNNAFLNIAIIAVLILTYVFSNQKIILVVIYIFTTALFSFWYLYQRPSVRSKQ